MKSLILFLLSITTVVTFFLGEYGATAVSFISTILLNDVFNHFKKDLPQDFWDDLDAINTQDADLERED